MNARCSNPNRPDYKFYGGRGITVCERWRKSFLAFLADMGEKPVGKSLDRKNNSRGYSRRNCRWATKDEQMQNTRATRLITFQDRTMGLNAWAHVVGIHRQTLSDRLRRGWPLEKALTTGATK